MRIHQARICTIFSRSCANNRHQELLRASFFDHKRWVPFLLTHDMFRRLLYAIYSDPYHPFRRFRELTNLSRRRHFALGEENAERIARGILLLPTARLAMLHLDTPESFAALITALERYIYVKGTLLPGTTEDDHDVFNPPRAVHEALHIFVKYTKAYRNYCSKSARRFVDFDPDGPLLSLDIDSGLNSPESLFVARSMRLLNASEEVFGPIDESVYETSMWYGE